MFFGLQQPIFDCLARAGLFGCGLSGLPALDTAFCKLLDWIISRQWQNCSLEEFSHRLRVILGFDNFHPAS